MKIWRKITVEKSLRYLFLVLAVGAGLMVLLNLSANLGFGNDGVMIRGWVNYGKRPVQPELLAMESGQIKVFHLRQIKLAMVQFDSLGAMLQGIPLVYLISQFLTDLSVALVFYLMMQIFRSLDKGEVFHRNNITRIRLIAYTILAFSVLTVFSSTLLAIFIQRSGTELRFAFPALNSERVILGALVALIILALLKAFKLGTQLQQEQGLTI